MLPTAATRSNASHTQMSADRHGGGGGARGGRDDDNATTSDNDCCLVAYMLCMADLFPLIIEEQRKCYQPSQPVPMPRQHSVPTPSPIRARATALAGSGLRMTTVMEAVAAVSNEEGTQDRKNSRSQEMWTVCVAVKHHHDQGSSFLLFSVLSS